MTGISTAYEQTKQIKTSCASGTKASCTEIVIAFHIISVNIMLTRNVTGIKV
jgi:hypothetical protein